MEHYVSWATLDLHLRQADRLRALASRTGEGCRAGHLIDILDEVEVIRLVGRGLLAQEDERMQLLRADSEIAALFDSWGEVTPDAASEG